MADSEQIQSAEDIEAAFEDDRPFSAELPEQSLGRLAWLGVRSSAEFLLTLQRIGVNPEHIPEIVDAVHELQTDFYEFVSTGLDVSEDDARDLHPLQGVVFDLVEGITLSLQEQSSRPILETLLDDRGTDGMYQYGEMADEDLLHALQQMKDNVLGGGSPNQD